jgi:deferrochelatase/peroxidase EfeB
MAGGCPFHSRRGFMGAVGGFATALGLSRGADAVNAGGAPQAVRHSQAEPFWGVHQSGIATPPQGHVYFAAFDLHAETKAQLAQLLQRWTDASVRMMAGQPATEDSGDAEGLSPSHLTVTIGFGPGMFTQNGHDRYGLSAHRPDSLADLPTFAGDQLDPAKTGGDISVQACADDPQVAFHAVRQLAKIGRDAAHLRWTQAGFNASFAAGDTPRNLMGFKDGTQNPSMHANQPARLIRASSQPAEEDFDKVVWAGSEGPAWMQGGSYKVVRRIRIALEHWDNTEVGFQEQTVGRKKDSGAPLGAKTEFDALDLDATDKDGSLIIPENAHVRMAAATNNDGAQILRRAFSYNDGTNVIAERWPPWRQGLEYDAGLFFIAYQRDPRTGFVKIFENMAKFDALNQFTTHCGSGLFACPGGAQHGGYIGQALIEA